MKITQLAVNHVENPIGYLIDSAPVFTWKVEEAAGKKQTAARIAVAKDQDMKDIVSDTGWRDSLDSLGTPVPVMVEPRTRYWWTVSVQSDAGEEAVSDPAFFETGKMSEPWTAKWIGCDMATERHPVFHKKFTADGRRVSAARLYITGLGLYHASLNGKPVTKEYLTPYCTDYNQWVEYQTYDVTDLIAKENQIDVTLGVGWYLGRFGFTSKPQDSCINPFYAKDGRFRLLAELVITYADNTSETVATDGTWTVTRSNITFSNIYDGEHRDDTLPESAQEACEVLGDATDLPVTERLSIPVLGHEIMKPAALIDTPAGEKVFDLGQNFAGIFRLRVHEPRGTKVHVQVGEVLQQGSFYNENLRTAKAEYWYTSDGEEHVIEPQFTFYGYRYAKVEGISDLSVDDFCGVAVYSDIREAGTWESSDALLNKLMSNIRWGQKSNFVDVPTDCPQRDERMGWTADTQVFVPTASYLADCWAFYRKFLHDLDLDQSEHGGMVPDVVPDFGVTSCAAVWGDAATFIPWNLYRWYGDKSILAKQMNSMKAWVDYIEKLDGDDRSWGRHFQYGDWLALDNPAGGVDQVKGGTDDAYIAYIYYMTSARIVAKSAEVLGDEDLAERYHEKADRLMQYVEDEFFTPNGRCAVNTMTGYILALYFDLTKDRRKTSDSLIRLIKAADGKLRTGFVGTPMANRVLSSMGQDKLAYDIIHNEDYPGWLHEIHLGATTVWERWNSLENDGSISSTGMNSFNHYAYGSIGQWMWETMAGIAPDENVPGFRHAILRLVPDYLTQSVHAAYNSAAGCYQTAWDVVDAAHVRVEITVPFNCTAILVIPYARPEEVTRELEAGSYVFDYELAVPLVEKFTLDTPIEHIMENRKAVEALSKVLPQFTQIPPQMQSMSINELARSFVPGTDVSKSNPMLDAVQKVFDENLF